MGLIYANGKPLLAGGKFLSVATGAAVTTPLTSLALQDFYSSHQYSRPVVQRKAGTYDATRAGTADVPVVFTFSGDSPAAVQAQVVDAANTATVITPWATLTGISVNGSTGAGVLPNVPAGGYYLIQLRDGNAQGTVYAGTKSWGVGVCVLAVGQSNMLGTLQAGSFNDAVPGYNTVPPVAAPGKGEWEYWMAGLSGGSQFGTYGYTHPGGSTGPEVGTNQAGMSSTMRMLSKGLSVKYGKLIPVGFIPWAQSGKDINELSPDGTISSPLFNGSSTTPGTMGMMSPGNIFEGDFEGMVWDQGESSESRSRADYLAQLKLLYTNLLGRVSKFGRTANDLFFMPAVLGVYTSVTQVEGKRGAVLDLETYAAANGWPKVKAGWNCLDLDPADGSDGLHFKDIAQGASQNYRVWSVRRMQQALLYAVGCSSFTGVGPRINTPAVGRTGNVITLPVIHDGGTDLALRNAGSAITGWSVKSAGADVAGFTVAIASPTSITITVPGGTVFPVVIQHGGGVHPTVSNLIVDNKPYPYVDNGAGANIFTGTDVVSNGRPLLPTPDAITVN